MNRLKREVPFNNSVIARKKNKSTFGHNSFRDNMHWGGGRGGKKSFQRGRIKWKRG